MTKFNLTLTGNEMLTKEQMRKISGAKRYECYAMDANGNHTDLVFEPNVSNGCEAQSQADAWAYSGDAGVCCGFDCVYPGEICN